MNKSAIDLFEAVYNLAITVQYLEQAEGTGELQYCTGKMQ